MKKLPLINIDKFEKKHTLEITSPPNCETLWLSWNTYHFQRKNNQREGIEIEWIDNPFELCSYYDYILEK